MSRALLTRLRKLEDRRKVRPELRIFVQETGETPEALTERAHRWKREASHHRTPRIVEVADE